MATSPTGIVNNGLLLLGEPTIANLEDPTNDIARACNGLWPDVRDAVLAEHPWNACVTQQTPTLLSVTIPFSGDYAYAYSYPPDCLRVYRVSDDRYAWRVLIVSNQKVIVSNDAALAVEYIFRQTNVTAYSSALTLALSHKMAALLALSLTGHLAKADKMALAYERVLRLAKAMDGQEQSPVEFHATALTDDVRQGS